MRILLAEDDHQLRDTIARGLREHAFAVDAVGDGDAAVSHAAVNEYDAADHNSGRHGPENRIRNEGPQ